MQSTDIADGSSIGGPSRASANVVGTEGRRGIGLDDSYLVKGLTGMARAEGWFAAHWGAGVLAGYYLCTENHLDEQVTAAIKKQLDAVIRLRAAQFAPLPEEPADKTSVADVAKALLPAIRGGLRAHGHAAIFASLSMKALHDVPYMAQPTLVDALCGLSRQIARKEPQKLNGRAVAAPYADTQTMVEAMFDSLVRFKELLGHPSIGRPNFTHMTTHTDALMTLEAMGYPELARAGHAGHRVHISAPVPELASAAGVCVDLAPLKTVMSKAFWNDPRNQDHWNGPWNKADNPNGDWIASGHLFKVLYSYHRLMGRINDIEKVDLCSRVLLERYMNPDVHGG